MEGLGYENGCYSAARVNAVTSGGDHASAKYTATLQIEDDKSAGLCCTYVLYAGCRSTYDLRRMPVFIMCTVYRIKPCTTLHSSLHSSRHHTLSDERVSQARSDILWMPSCILDRDASKSLCTSRRV